MTYKELERERHKILGPAFHFYQKLAFRLTVVYRNTFYTSREMKPVTPIVGIPIRDENKMGLRLDEQDGIRISAINYRIHVPLSAICPR